MGLQVPVSLPAGSISPFAGATAPDGWLFMYGQAISRTIYKALFDAIGTTFGAGDGVNTFNLPDARGRVLFGKDNMGGTAANRATLGGGGLDGVKLGAVGGGETKTLSEAQIAIHQHMQHGATMLSTAGGGLGIGAGTNYPSGGTTNFTGGGGAHSVIPPALVINYIIKT